MAIANLKRHYENTINASEFYAEKIGNEAISIKDSVFADMSQDEMSPLEKLARSSEEVMAELPGYVKPGVWFKIYTTENQPPRRLKLSIITSENARMIFVDRKGVKGIEKDVNQFCVELLTGKSTMLEDHSVFDQALFQVISQIASNK